MRALPRFHHVREGNKVELRHLTKKRNDNADYRLKSHPFMNVGGGSGADSCLHTSGRK